MADSKTELHHSGARVLREQQAWRAVRVDGSSGGLFRTACLAKEYLVECDANCWSFERPGISILPLGGILVDSATARDQRVFNVRTCEAFGLQRFALNFLQKNAVAIASCARCGRVLRELNFQEVTYLGDRPDRYLELREEHPAYLPWLFLVCGCGYPAWVQDDMHVRLARLNDAQKSADRRDRERSAEGRHSQEDIEAIYALQKGLCYYCGEPFSSTLKYTKDHKISLARGGTQNADNLCLACKSCNSRKNSLSATEFQCLLIQHKCNENSND